MRRHTAGAFGALLCVGAAAAAFAPAAAGVSGNQAVKGVIVTSGKSGDRVIISSEIVAKGVLNGNGEIVEVPSRPGDPDNVFRDDFVFRGGTIHVESTFFDASFSLNERSCHFTAHLDQTA